jgi:arylsulfatase A-like enzyme
VLAEHAAQIAASTPPGTPLFLYFAPYSAHAPFVPAPRHQGTWDQPVHLPLAFNEPNMADKPSFLRGLPMQDGPAARRQIRRQHEMLLSADEAVGQILDSLGERAHTALVVVMGDNGSMHGAHRINGKGMAYAEATDIPLAIRWPGQVARGATSTQIVMNVDVAATVAAAGLAAQGWLIDGRDIREHLRTGAPLEMVSRERFSRTFPAYCGFRTRRWLFVEWSDDRGRELYHYPTDPGELHNLAGQRGYRDQLRRLRGRAMMSCDPVPPGFTWD